jgi:hypothetical protein
MSAHDRRRRGDRKVGFGGVVDENQADLRHGVDFIVLGAAPVDQEPDQAGVTVRSGFQRAGAHAIVKTRRHHADTDLSDDVPYATGIRRNRHVCLLMPRLSRQSD